MSFSRPSYIPRVYKYEEAKILHQRTLEYTSNLNKITALPRLAIHSSVATHSSPYFLALMELRSGTLNGQVVRDDGVHSLNNLKICRNSY